jgi:hypothetical protein
LIATVHAQLTGNKQPHALNKKFNVFTHI